MKTVSCGDFWDVSFGRIAWRFIYATCECESNEIECIEAVMTHTRLQEVCVLARSCGVAPKYHPIVN